MERIGGYCANFSFPVVDTNLRNPRPEVASRCEPIEGPGRASLQAASRASPPGGLVSGLSGLAYTDTRRSKSDER
ncbi:hypothetical protein V6N12_001331 [Hibiscus sabdariffa]|uniref:Uncharacterized protein n=1 Tax=Hibiscus sabdariffa TaxID=183260 RepID=A0ABR2B163_9ROSI